MQGLIGREAELFVAFHLQKGQIEKLGRMLLGLFLFHLGDFQWFVRHLPAKLLGGLFRGEPAFGTLELASPVEGAEFPEFFRLEILYRLLAFHQDSQGRGLDAAYRQDLAGDAEFEGIGAAGIHPQQPVADGPHRTGSIEIVEIGSGIEFGEAFLDGFFGQRGYPKAFHRHFAARLLHDPSLDHLPFLPGIAAVDHFLAPGHQVAQNLELVHAAFFRNQLQLESRRNHRQHFHPPSFPFGGIVVRFEKGAEMAEGPRHPVAVAFHIAVLGGRGPDYTRYLPAHAGLFGYTKFHFLSLLYLSIPLKPKSVIRLWVDCPLMSCSMLLA